MVTVVMVVTVVTAPGEGGGGTWRDGVGGTYTATPAMPFHRCAVPPFHRDLSPFRHYNCDIVSRSTVSPFDRDKRSPFHRRAPAGAAATGAAAASARRGAGGARAAWACSGRGPPPWQAPARPGSEEHGVGVRVGQRWGVGGVRLMGRRGGEERATATQRDSACYLLAEQHEHVERRGGDAHAANREGGRVGQQVDVGLDGVRQ